MNKLLAALLLLAAQTAAADTLSGRVVSVANGDTLTVLDQDREQHKVRLSGIDAPEKSQPFGQRSKQSLSDLSYGRSVSVEWRKRDRYRRIVGKVLEGGRDVNFEQVRRGVGYGPTMGRSSLGNGGTGLARHTTARPST
jgi:endonuclease YncB( thermonuclease family)